MNMNGSVSGKDNILETLRFLNKLCQGMGSPLQTIHLQPMFPTTTATTPVTLASKPEVLNAIIGDPEVLECEDSVFKEEIEEDDDDIIIISDDDSSPDPEGALSEKQSEGISTMFSQVPEDADETTIHLAGYSVPIPPYSLQDPLGMATRSAPPPPQKPKTQRKPPKYREPQVCSICGKLEKAQGRTTLRLRFLRHQIHSGDLHETSFAGYSPSNPFFWWRQPRCFER